MKRACIIIPYFGKFPKTIEPFIRSCEYNKNFQWLFFTDDRSADLKRDNIDVVYCHLEDIQKLVEKKLQMSAALRGPYKLCDYRPAFGVIFEDYLKGFDFWGYGDTDLVYGDLRNFITDEIFDSYDKIYPCGHLSLYRNCELVNYAYRQETENSQSYQEVFSTNQSRIFDEYQGINEKLMSLGAKIYAKFEFADMDLVYRRFRTVDTSTIRWVFEKYPFKHCFPKNFRMQTFYFQKGKLFRAYLDAGIVKEKELSYCHYRYKIPCSLELGELDEFYITNTGIVKKGGPVTAKKITELNPYPGVLYELREYVTFVRERGKTKLAKHRGLRKVVRRLKGKTEHYE